MREYMPYMWIYTLDPFTGTRVVTGAMLLDGVTVRYIERRSPPAWMDPSSMFFRLLCDHADLLRRQAHPWDIGPHCTAEGRWRFVPKDADGGPREWLLKSMEQDL
jgi:hypothetical protein